MIIIDPGHGGSDSGAIGKMNVREADVTLSLAYRLCTFLPSLAVMTRTSDYYVSLSKRATMYPNGTAFISLHCNSHHSESASGFEIWTSPGRTEADSLAESIYRSVISSEQNGSKRLFRHDMSDGDRDKESRFTVLTRTAMPAVLIEVGFLSNSVEEMLLISDSFMRRQAYAISVGIEQWLSSRR